MFQALALRLTSSTGTFDTVTLQTADFPSTAAVMSTAWALSFNAVMLPEGSTDTTLASDEVHVTALRVALSGLMEA